MKEPEKYTIDMYRLYRDSNFEDHKSYVAFYLSLKEKEGIDINDKLEVAKYITKLSSMLYKQEQEKENV